MSKTSAVVIADSLSPYADRAVSIEATYPRIILAEINTHRVFSRNLSSSRAIPFHKALKSVLDNPFIPIAFQKEHSGMQGTEYHNPDELFSLSQAMPKIKTLLDKVYIDEIGEVPQAVITQMLQKYESFSMTLSQWWLFIRDKVLELAILLYGFGVSKQLANRLLEPFMYVKAVITSTEWENFFKLRCPQYVLDLGDRKEYYRSYQEWENRYNKIDRANEYNIIPTTTIDQLKLNKGQAEIHMMALAEAIYDAIWESKPTALRPGEWHIPYQDKIFQSQWFDLGVPMLDIMPNMIKMSTAMCARTSYTIIGEEKEISVEKLFEIHDDMAIADPFHASPFEHNMQVMTGDEHFHKFYKVENGRKIYGVCHNMTGFKTYRYMVERGIKVV